MKTIGGVFTSVLLVGAAVFVPAPQQAQSRPLPAPLPAAVPSIPTPQPAPTPSLPTPRREQGPSVPVPAATTAPSVPKPAVTPIPSIPAPVPSPSIPAAVQSPSAPAPASGSVQQKRTRLIVVAPWDSSSIPLVNAVYELLASDLRGQSVNLLPHAEVVQYARAAGFPSNASMAPTDVKALGALMRADLAIGLMVRPSPGGLHVYASVITAGDPAPHRIMEGDGSVARLAEVLMRALHADSAYTRLRQSQTDAMSSPPTATYIDSIAARLSETEIKRANALALFEPSAIHVKALDAQVAAYQEHLSSISRSASASRTVAQFVLKRLDERQVALAINHRQALVTFDADSPLIRAIAREELQVEKRRAELRTSLRLAPKRVSQE